MIGVIINPWAGFVLHHGLDHVRNLIEEIVPGTRIHVLAPTDTLSAVCRAFMDDGVSCVAAAGGDGTMNSVAACLLGTETALGVIPAGTLNHFARDVGVGRNLDEALRVLARGYILPVDVAQVNERIFLNNSSIGLYPHMVEIRRRNEKRLGKWRALVYASWLASRHSKPMTVRVVSDGLTEDARAHLLFVGNNQYELDLLHLGQRASLNAGELYCYILEGPGRLGLIPYIFGYLRDHRVKHHILHALATREIAVTPAGRRHIDVACDGEIFRLAVPLDYRVLPKALNVVVPKPPPPQSREARDNEDVS